MTGFTPETGVPDIKSTLRWRKPKSHFAHLCHAIKVGGCIMDDDSFSELVRNMAAALNLDVTVHYVNNIISSLKSKDSSKGVTEFLDGLKRASKKTCSADLTMKTIEPDVHPLNPKFPV